MPRAPSRRGRGPDFLVGQWRVDPGLNQVVHGDRRVHLEPRVMDLLVYLASRPGEVVTKEELTREVWQGAFIGDAALVSAVSALRRALDEDARQPRVVQTVPKRGYRLIAPVSGREASVAVLPLENLSGDPDEEFFADGMTDALISALGSNRRGLRVTSRTSSMRFKRSSLMLPEIAQRLDVGMIVEGSVMRQAELVRISVQLVDARTDQQLWSEVFERSLGDVLALQSELAHEVDRRIRATLGHGSAPEAPPARTVDPQSFLEYLRGRSHVYRFTQGLFGRALAHFEAAREMDPGSPFPYLGIAEVWGWRTIWGLVPPAAARPEVERATLKAVELGDGLAEAHAMLAKYAYYFEWSWAEAEEAFARSLELNRSDSATLWSHGLFQISRNHTSEALSLARRATELDPLDPNPEAVLGVALMLSGRSEESLAVCRRACERDPIPPPRLVQWMALAGGGRLDEALEAAAAYYSIVGRADVSEMLTAKGAGSAYQATMERAARALVSQRRHGYVQPTQIARLFLHAGQHELALEWLERAYRERDTWLVHLLWPEWEPLRARPDFCDLLDRIGLPRTGT